MAAWEVRDYRTVRSACFVTKTTFARLTIAPGTMSAGGAGVATWLRLRSTLDRTPVSRHIGRADPGTFQPRQVDADRNIRRANQTAPPLHNIDQVSGARGCL